MNAKRLGLFALSVLSLIFLMSFASASVSLVNVTSITQTIDNTNAAITGNANTVTVSFQLQENGQGNLTNIAFTNLPITLTSGTNIIVSSGTLFNQISSLSQGTTSPIMSLTFSIPTNIPIGKYTYNGNLAVTGQYTNSVSYNLSLPLISVTVTADSNLQPGINCNSFGSGQLKINSIDFTNNGLPVLNTTFGNDNTWFPFENINTKVDVKSLNSSNDLNSLEVDWGIWDTQQNGGKGGWIIIPSELKNIDLSGGKTKSLYQNFSINNNIDVDLSSLNNGNHYYFVVTANGADSNSNAVCTYKAKQASVALENDFVIFTKLNVPSPVQCGQNVQVTGQLWNIGKSDQNAVSVDILGSDPSLQLSKNVAVGDINKFNNKQFSFSFQVPGSVSENPYSMKLQVLDENGNIFQENKNNHNSEFLIPLTVHGGCSLQSQVSLTANIISGGQAGNPLQVKATITNTGTVQRTYTVQTSGYQTWSSSASVNQGTITLAPGQSQDVVVTFNVNKDTMGTQTFSLDMTSGSQSISQPVSVNIQGSSGFLGLGGNSLIWVIGAFNLILIIVIIIVAVRVARR